VPKNNKKPSGIIDDFRYGFDSQDLKESGYF